MIGNNGMVRALNLDDNEIPVTIGGRGFILKQQAKKPLMRVLDAIFKSDEEEVKAATEKADIATENADTDESPADETIVPLEDNVAETFMKEWDKALPVIAMMLGQDPRSEDTWNEALAFLEENLAPMAGVKVFKAWWGLNEIDSFFLRCGRTLIHPEMEAGIEQELKRQMAARVQEVVKTAIDAQQALSE